MIFISELGVRSKSEKASLNSAKEKRNLSLGTFAYFRDGKFFGYYVKSGQIFSLVELYTGGSAAGGFIISWFSWNRVPVARVVSHLQGWMTAGLCSISSLGTAIGFGDDAKKQF